ncbi:hypothetical protein CGCSCA4_v009551 [Colletotrichum siamense]|uniref:Uncharacterized protein n=1 Tax=Colletotrichum siamense TaxID=690259 RepID=A0A9P5K1W9_COLSI|nr:hypothetical protein CGCSCA4_v009551 [Colletotrichum siamense]KAF4854801.1 hypothetical protein CGCSCA2_v009425 [Colletotrichum siamense]
MHLANVAAFVVLLAAPLVSADNCQDRIYPCSPLSACNNLLSGKQICATTERVDGGCLQTVTGVNQGAVRCHCCPK